MQTKFERGQRVMVEGFGGRRATLRVWSDKGRGVTLCSEQGYWRLLAGETGAAQVGFPKGDIRSVLPTEQPPPA